MTKEYQRIIMGLEWVTIAKSDITRNRNENFVPQSEENPHSSVIPPLKEQKTSKSGHVPNSNRRRIFGVTRILPEQCST